MKLLLHLVATAIGNIVLSCTPECWDKMMGRQKKQQGPIYRHPLKQLNLKLLEVDAGVATFSWEDIHDGPDFVHTIETKCDGGYPHTEDQHQNEYDVAFWHFKYCDIKVMTKMFDRHQGQIVIIGEGKSYVNTSNVRDPGFRYPETQRAIVVKSLKGIIVEDERHLVFKWDPFRAIPQPHYEIKMYHGKKYKIKRQSRWDSTTYAFDDVDFPGRYDIIVKAVSSENAMLGWGTAYVIFVSSIPTLKISGTKLPSGTKWNLHWLQVTNATQYDVEVKNSFGVQQQYTAYNPVCEVDLGTPSFLNSKLQIVVVALDSNGEVITWGKESVMQW